MTNPGNVAKNPPNTRTAIAALSEDDLRVKVLVPMLRALGCIKVEDWQGPQENGKDIYFAYHDVLGDVQHCCVFIKQGDITKSGSTDIRKYEARAELDIYDFENASPAHDRHLLFQVGVTAAHMLLHPGEGRY